MVEKKYSIMVGHIIRRNFYVDDCLKSVPDIMGDVWERQIRTVRSVSAPLLQEFGTRLDDEGYHTMLCAVDNIVNSQPLTSVSNSMDDLNPLTPNHLLTMKSSMVVPPPGNVKKNDVYTRKRWRHVQYIANVFWARWKKEYRVTLQEQQQWTTPRRNAKVGDILLVKDTNLPQNMWNMGRVVGTDQDKTGIV